MPVLQGPPIEDDEEDYDEEEPPLSEDIEDEEDVDDEAGPSAAAGSRGTSLCSDPCVSHSRGPLAGIGMAGACAEVAEAGLAMSAALQMSQLRSASGCMTLSTCSYGRAISVHSL